MNETTITDMNSEQKAAFRMLQEFISSGEEKFFVLNGYAGTGKTTIIRYFSEYLLDKKIPFTLLASTGRAAKVLSKKTGFKTSTVHRLIYVLDISELDENSKSKKVTFRLANNNAPETMIYVIDESSMISDKQLTQIFALFGTGSLLDDFILYSGRRKIIFVGDNAQLTPINSSFCPALNLQYLTMKYRYSGTKFDLKTIVRFIDIAVVRSNAQSLINIIREDNVRVPLKIKTLGFNNVRVFPLDVIMIEEYVEKFKNTGIDNCIFITFSNKLASMVNKEIRFHLYGTNPGYVLPGEILMVQQNNYLHEIANGEHIEVINITGKELHRAGLTFVPIEAEVNEPHGKRKFTCLLIKDYLDLKESRLNNEAEYSLTKDFMIRMKKKGIDPVKTPDIFKDMLISDKYLNAIRARYGYAVTCHKAQGGEWPNVYIILEKTLWHPNNKKLIHRWAYTAITRTQANLFLLDNIAIS